MQTKNAKIESTSIGELGRGFSSFIHLKYDENSSQGYGGYALGDVFTYQWIKGITEAVGVDTWEELPGKYCRVQIDDSGLIKRIGHLLNDTWYEVTPVTRK